MSRSLMLASSSTIRLRLLQQAGLQVLAKPARIDEVAIRQSLQAEKAKPPEVADALAEMKARKLSERTPEALVLGCDQVLAFNSQIYGKPETKAEAHSQLVMLRGQSHELISALVLYDEGKPIWRYADTAKLTMRSFTDSYLDAYLARNWQSLQFSVGSYKLEEEGIRLFSSVVGDYFTILGLPLLPLLSYLTTRGFIDT
jgi:septum formation protein